MRAASPAAAIETEIEARVPALNDEDAREAVELLSELTGQNSAEVVSFGTDAGHFCNAGISTVVFGPGSIEQAHKPDEFIERSQIAACMTFLDRLGDRLTH
jgi:acetylornithine deacetylase